MRQFGQEFYDNNLWACQHKGKQIARRIARAFPGAVVEVSDTSEAALLAFPPDDERCPGGYMGVAVEPKATLERRKWDLEIAALAVGMTPAAGWQMGYSIRVRVEF